MYNEVRNPFFNIDREAIFTESGKPVDKDALINSETGDVLGIVSKGYEVVTNNDINEIFQEAMNEFKIEKVVDHMDSDTKRWKRQIIFGDDELNFPIVSDDIVGICLEIYNGYNAKTSFGYNIMGYRWMCKNGMMMGKQELFKESYAHLVDNPEKLVESFQMKFDSFHKNSEMWKEWAKTPMSKGDFELFVNSHTKPDTGRSIKSQYIGSKVSKAIIDEYEPTLNELKLSDTKWGAFNVLTSLATHGTKARSGSNVFSKRYSDINRLASDMYEKKEIVLL